MKTLIRTFILSTLTACTGMLFGAGTLSSVDSGLRPAEIINHDVDVTINNSYARTEVTQQFRNTNDSVMEAVYSFPVPRSASLSECQVLVGEKVMNGEVLPREKAHEVYESEKSSGNQAAIADKEGYQDFTFAISNLQPGETATISFVYYQPLPLDTETCRYVYPLEEGHTKDGAAENFWTRNDKPTGKTTMHVRLKSAWPISAWRAPYGTPSAVTEDLENGSVDAMFELSDGLGKDFVFYYILENDLPGRLEVIPYKEAGKDGYFMMVLTPGVDLKPIDCGADYVFVLDVSGSMYGDKLATLANGVTQAIQKMNSEDRFRIITFSDSAKDITGGYRTATPENVKKAVNCLGKLSSEGSTNMYDGLKTALSGMEDDRVTSLVLVTDGVTNTGEVQPAQFKKLMSQRDIRVFGFLMGNGSNWPLMRTICDASGGFYDGVSNSDDIVGRILLAKSKITHQAMHDVKISISGVKTYDVTKEAVRKLYRGEQLVLFGRYSGHGNATVTMKTRISGENQEYSCSMVFPEVDGDNPELERMWALGRLEMAETLANNGEMEHSEYVSLQKNIGVDYQIVTDETSMVILTDEGHAAHGIERRNQQRVATERAAQAARQAAPVQNYRVGVPAGSNPRTTRRSFKISAPSLGGGGAMDPWMMVALGVMAISAMGFANKKK